MSELARQIEAMEEQVVSLLDDAMAMELGLSSEDSDYDYHFIREKLAKVSSYQEKLSDIMMRLSKISLVATKQALTSKTLVQLSEKRLKASDEYQNLHVASKGGWLADQLLKEEEAALRWQQLKSLVSEVKEAVTERAGTMKRLDSDLRLHVKLLEVGGASGATSPTSYTGSKATDLDID